MDPACYTGNINHQMVVVGYELNTVLPYWILRNSWGDTWGERGYMRMVIQAGDGICGINVLPVIYPVINRKQALRVALRVLERRLTMLSGTWNREGEREESITCRLPGWQCQLC